MKDVQCYEIFGGIALKNHAFSFSFFSKSVWLVIVMDCLSGYSYHQQDKQILGGCLRSREGQAAVQ